MPITDAHDRQSAGQMKPPYPKKPKPKVVVKKPKQDAHDRQPAPKAPKRAAPAPAPKQDAHDRQTPTVSPRLRSVESDAATRTERDIVRERRMRSRQVARGATRPPKRSGGGFSFPDLTPDAFDRFLKGIGEESVSWLMRRANAPQRHGGIYDVVPDTAATRGVGAAAEAMLALQMDPNTTRFIMNQPYDPKWAIAGGIFGFAGMGSPAHVGASVGKEAISNVDLLAKAAAKQKNSSRVAKLAGDALEKAGFDPEGPVVKFARNGRDRRVFRNVGESDVSEVSVDAAKSRTFKLGEKAYDKARPVVSRVGFDVKGKRIALAKTEREKWAQALEAEARDAHRQAQVPLKVLEGMIGRSTVGRWFKRLEVPEFYALRMVGKGVDPGTMINRFKALAAEARAAGDVSKARRLDYHAAMSEAAGPLVAVRGGDVVFSDEAPRKLRAVYEEIERAGANRERIYQQLDLLDSARAAQRVTNEELWHYGATFRNTEDYIREQIEANPNRQALYDIARAKGSDEEAQALIDTVDAQARWWMEERMTRMSEGIARMKEVERQVVLQGGNLDAGQVALRKRLEAEYKRGIDPSHFYRQWNETLTEVPADAYRLDPQSLAEITPFHGFAEAKGAANLKAKLNPKNKLKGKPQNRRIFRKVNGQTVVVLGDVTPEQWVKRVLAVMPDVEERAAWSRWYDDFENTFRAIFKEDADALMRGFAVSQANASPGSGLRAVFKIMDALMRGEKVEKGYGSVVAASIAKAIEGGEIDKGIAAKLSDFIDSLMLSPTRTWMGNKVEGGRPVAVDVHAARDRGLVDQKLFGKALAGGRESLTERFGIAKGDVVVDNPGGSPSGPRYERVAEWYEDLTDHLNKVAFDGRTDWEPRQVQALGWAAIQKLHGADPQDFGVALSQNTRRVSFEVTQGPGNLGAHLTPEQATEVAKALEPDMRRLVEHAGGYLNGVRYSVDGWAGGTNAGVHLDVVGSDDAIDKMLTLVAQAFDQGLVQGTRTATRAGAKAALVISSPAFADEAVKTAFMKRVYELSPKLSKHGYMSDTFMNQPATKVVTSRGYLGPKTTQKFLDQFKGAIDQAEEEFGISVRYGTKNTEILIGDQVGRTSYNATAGRARELDDLDPVARDIRERLTGLIESVDSGRHGADELASAAGRPGGDVAGGNARAAADAAAGRRLVEGREGYEQAAEAIRGGTLPVPWLQDLVKDTENLHNYDKWRIGAHLSALSEEGGGPSLIGFKTDSVPGLEKILHKTELHGMYRGPQRQIVVTEHGRIPTILHELSHMAQDRKLFTKDFVADLEDFLKVENGEWTEKQFEEVADIFEAVFLGFKASDSELPARVKGPLEKIRKLFIDDAAKGQQKDAEEMFKRLNDAGPIGRRIADAVENMHFYREFGGARFHGASDQFRNRGKVYMPETLALPTSFGKGLYLVKAYGSRLGNSLGHKSTILPGDKALSHEFTGHLLESGAFDRNVVKGTAYAQMKAARIWAMAVVRREARKIGYKVPQSADDVAIPEDALKFAGDQGKDIDFVAGMLNSIEEGKVIGAAELSKVDANAIEQARNILFPGLTGDSAQEIRRLAEEILAGVREPIDGVVWVNRRDLLNTAMFNPSGAGTRAVKRVTAPVNDYLKALLLTLKPSFIPMNFVGNTVMALMQQGAFAPLNYARAWHLNRALGDDAVLVDFFAGSGWMSVFDAKGGIPGLSPVLDVAADVSSFLVDRHWRRAAFLYEARKAGYSDAEEIRKLLKDPAFSEDLATVSQRTRNAMVDFDNLSQLEKDWMTELVFVYPWFKGATYWAGRFVKDHPFQSAVYAYLISQQQDRLQDALPDGRPGYLKWFLPLGTDERDGKEYPVGIRLDQALTFLTPLDLMSDAAHFASGGKVSLFGNTQPEAVGSMLNPLYDEILKTLTGYDSFTGQPVEGGLPNLFARLLPGERMVVVQQIKNILDDGKRKNSIYHATEQEAWMKLFLGSLAKQAIDPEKAAERSKGLGMERSDEESLDLWKMKARNTFGSDPPGWLVQYKKNQQAYNDLESAELRKLGNPDGGLTSQERLIVLFKLDAQIRGTTWNREQDILGLDDDQADDYIRDLRKDLGLTQIDRFDREIGEARKEQRRNG